MGRIKRVKGNLGRKKETELGGLFSTSAAGAQANLTYWRFPQMELREC